MYTKFHIRINTVISQRKIGVSMKNINVLAEQANIGDAMKMLFNFKGYYFTIHKGKVMISDHPAKIEYNLTAKRKIIQIPMSYNGWLVWKGMMSSFLTDLVIEDLNERYRIQS